MYTHIINDGERNVTLVFNVKGQGHFIQENWFWQVQLYSPQRGTICDPDLQGKMSFIKENIAFNLGICYYFPNTFTYLEKGYQKYQ